MTNSTHNVQSVHLNLRCDDGKRRTIVMIGQLDLENGWWPGGVRSRENGWDGIQSGCWGERERKARFWLRQGCIIQKLDPFLSNKPQLFWESVHRGGKYISTWCRCKLRSGEQFILWLHGFVSAREAKKAGGTVICHTRTLTVAVVHLLQLYIEHKRLRE